ncbi:MAG: nitroreductase [Muribaculaceae bacterium]|nr:nitroreductase [Muribaculaceae bacterium]MDE6610295.1 nitroreductase [Muribaculaceae bacterium]
MNFDLGLSPAELVEAIEARHSVRVYYADRPLAPEIVSRLCDALAGLSAEVNGLTMRLVVNEPRAFGGRWASYGNFKGVENYIVISTRRGSGLDVKIGEQGEKVVLLAQHLGLNTCWVGLTYSKVSEAFDVPKGEKVRCVIALGYGIDGAGRHHKIKRPDQVSNIESDFPEWFKEGVRLAVLAPTAVNQQKFYFRLMPDGVTVRSTTRFSLIGYTGIDLGIARLHFAIGSGREAIL